MKSQEPPPGASLHKTTLEWGVAPPSSHPSRVREFLVSAFAEVLNRDDADRVGLVSHELLENILKYSSGGISSFVLTLSREGDVGHITIRTRNQVTAERLREAEAHIRRIGLASNPTRMYDELVASSPQREGSGLGLARIRVEGDMAIGCLADDLALTIFVEGQVAIRGAA